MLQFYKLFRKKSEPAPAMYLFLITNIIFWFLAGAPIGAVFAFCFLDSSLVVSCALTIGACFSLAIGYVYGYITVIRNF